MEMENNEQISTNNVVNTSNAWLNHENILALPNKELPTFALAKNRSRFARLINTYKQLSNDLEITTMKSLREFFKKEANQLKSLRENKLEYEMELETGNLTPSQKSYKEDELKMCQAHEKMGVHIVTKIQEKIKDLEEQQRENEAML